MLVCVERSEPQLLAELADKICVARVDFEMSERTDLRKRRTELNITSIELDARSGMQEGYASKLENYGRPQGRGMGPETFPLWLGGLKCGIILVDLPRAERKQGSIRSCAA